MPFRTIDTDIWSKARFYDLTPAQKVMFIYLFSNPLVSNIGVLEVSRKQLAATKGVSLQLREELNIPDSMPLAEATP